jgi:murein DD-endopeptidase MepM/ murein hydrolase activator NlpD
MRIAPQLLFFALLGIFIALFGVEGLNFVSPVSSQTQASGDYWRLPYPAGSSYDVSPGYGYNEGTHDDEDSYALDLQLPENSYVSAIQQGTVQKVFTGSAYCNGYGNYIDIVDIGGFVHRYAHMNAVFFSVGDEVLPGWVIGQSGATGYTIPCGAAHLHFRITDPDSNECTSGECQPEPMSDQCNGFMFGCGAPFSPFSHDPGWDGDPWKDVVHPSNNAGVGDLPVFDFQPIPEPSRVPVRGVSNGSTG